MGNLFGTSANETVPANGVKKEVPANETVPATTTPDTIPVNRSANGTAGGKRKGGYRPTKKDKTALKKLKQGKSIGFTMRSSLKAKGLLRRANGTMRVSAKYKKN